MKRKAPHRPVLSEVLAKAGEKGLRESLQLVGEIVRARVARLSDGRQTGLRLPLPASEQQRSAAGPDEGRAGICKPIRI